MSASLGWHRPLIEWGSNATARSPLYAKRAPVERSIANAFDGKRRLTWRGPSDFNARTLADPAAPHAIRQANILGIL